MSDELSERVAEVLRPHMTGSIWGAQAAEDAADVVLAAIDLDAVRDEGRQQGRREAAERIAYRIEAELVCCDIYEQHAEAGTYDETVHRHALCYWGEAAAGIARTYPWERGEGQG